MNWARALAGVACGVVAALALVPAASAQVTATSTSQTATVTGYNPAAASGTVFFSGAVPNSAYQFNYGSSVFAYENYQVSTNITGSSIDFANNATSQGFGATTSTSTTVSVTYTNNTANTVTPTLNSTITPAGFGFYTANPSANPTSVGGVASDVNVTPETLGTTFYDNVGYPYYATKEIGAVSVSFEILNGATNVADYNASLTLYLTGGGPSTDATGSLAVLSQSSTTGLTLNNFNLIASDNPNNAVGYEWDATPISIALSSLASGQSSTLTYITTVSAMTDDYAALPTADTLGYAGFGDPIGRTAGAGGINDPTFNLVELAAPTFDPTTGDLSAFSFQRISDAALPLTDLDNANAPTDPSSGDLLALPAPPSGAVPEPATWALLLVGVGGVGGMLRRRAPLRAESAGPPTATRRATRRWSRQTSIEPVWRLSPRSSSAASSVTWSSSSSRRGCFASSRTFT